MGGCLVPQRRIYSGLEGGGIEYVLVCLPVKDGKSLLADSVKEVLEKGKFYPKPVLAAADGSGHSVSRMRRAILMPNNEA